MTAKKHLVFQSGVWEIDVRQRQVRLRGVPVPLTSRSFDLLVRLAESAGQYISKETLTTCVWGQASVRENTLHVHISAIRKALGPDRSLLRTDARRGYGLFGHWIVACAGDFVESDQPNAHVLLAKGNLPVGVPSLIGRAQALNHLRETLTTFRAVTLTGAGGIGKTALAIEVVRNLPTDFDDGRWLVDLASLSEPNLVPAAVAAALRLKLEDRTISVASIVRAIGNKKLFLLIDNCEHVIDSAARLAEAILQRCPFARILATSREFLGIDGEYVFRVPSLSLPTSDQEELEQLLRRSAVALFMVRVKALDPAFSANSSNSKAIAAICRKLDGIPLAIELAAAPTAELGVAQVAESLETRFDTLVGRHHRVLPRHQTLSAILDWSYALLSEHERKALRSLSVLSGPFTLQAAERIAATDRSRTDSLLDLIGSLVAKSLVVVEAGGAGSRFRLFETTRSYALRKLRQSGEYDRIASLHAQYFLDIFLRSEADWQGATNAETLPTSDNPIGNLKSAIDWAFSPAGDPRLGISLAAAAAPHLIDHSLTNECRQHVDRALEVLNAEPASDPSEEMKLLTAQGTAALYEGNEDRASLERAISIADQLGDEGYRLRTRWALCHTWFNEGNFLASEPVVRDFWHLSATAADPSAVISGDYCMGILQHVLDNQVGALEHAERVLAHPDVSINRSVMALGLSGAIYWHFGNYDQSKQRLRQSEELAFSHNQFLGLCNVLANWSCPLSLYRGDLDDAERGLCTLRDCARRYGLSYWLAWANCFEGVLLTQRGDFDAGPEMIRATFATFPTTNSVRFTTLRTWYADCLMQAGRCDEALDVVDSTIERCTSHGVAALVPENYRLKGEILQRRDMAEAVEEARSYFIKGLGLAYRSGALSWQLRLAMSLARLSKGCHHEDIALADLARIYACFSDREATTDLKAAYALLKAEQQ
ncbi:ATP-binding protein [Reyranella soli]|uniref:ATP-binding protein n=1 Tax=Reyranella soli TaxID=1230389 RepID=UPI001478DEEC|nr:winged helix-turn-helix domain-containing protein [Reyranella soli]